MKLLEKLALKLFSVVMLVLAIISCLVLFNIIDISVIFNFFEKIMENDIVCKSLIGFNVVVILLAIKALVFPSKMIKSEEIKSGVLLENKDGRLLISRDTIESLVNGVVKSFDEALDVQTKIVLDVNNGITVFLSLLVKEDAVIKDLSIEIQNKIKESVKRSTELDVNQVNIKIKNIENNKGIVKTENKLTKIKIDSVKDQTNVTKENI